GSPRAASSCGRCAGGRSRWRGGPRSSRACPACRPCTRRPGTAAAATAGPSPRRPATPPGRREPARSSCSPTSPTRPATPSTGASATAPWKTARCSPSPPPRLDASASRRPPPTARAAGRGGLLDAGLLHVAEFALELLDLVAEAGGELELEVGGGLVHLLGHLLDEALQLLAGPLADQVGGVAADLPGAGRETRAGRLAAALLPPGPADEGLGVGVLADEGVEDVGDPLAERLRFDAVLLV